MKINKVNKQLICITGTMGSGKSTAINFIKKLGYQTFIMDDYIHKIYKKNKIGYKIIKNNFGETYINDKEVDRTKLRELILYDKNMKKKLENLMNIIIEKKLINLINENKLIFVELGIYIYHQCLFNKYFDKVILVNSNRKEKIDNFKKFHSNIKFSTNRVDNLKKIDNSNIVYVDYIVENDVDMENFHKKIWEILYKINKKS